ncbi:hypothetical protein QBC40DRAFT_296849 [Triangularia verruculosa]|uniref:Uncharacterized protein n=1 Tax=Triangularia verruculosa TaxID=2587418 RepID=A0AAN7AWS2_9PEZI|nr:hypothetical protein QBC40DRAFT_296849 [Triangularia verruculosa]
MSSQTSSCTSNSNSNSSTNTNTTPDNPAHHVIPVIVPAPLPAWLLLAAIIKAAAAAAASSRDTSISTQIIALVEPRRETRKIDDVSSSDVQLATQSKDGNPCAWKREERIIVLWVRWLGLLGCWLDQELAEISEESDCVVHCVETMPWALCRQTSSWYSSTWAKDWFADGKGHTVREKEDVTHFFRPLPSQPCPSLKATH